MRKNNSKAYWFSLPLCIILGAAAIFRVAYVLQYHSRSVYYLSPILDASIYDAWARRIAAGIWTQPEPFAFAPGYPYLLGMLYRIFSPSIDIVCIFQSMLGLLNIYLIYRLAVRAFSRRAAIISASLAALYGTFPLLETKLMSPVPALTLLLFSLLAIDQAAEQKRYWLWVVSGALFGATTLIRPETMLCAPFLCVWIWKYAAAMHNTEMKYCKPVFAMALLAAGWAVAISPAAVHNLSLNAGSTLISTQGGITFYQSNNPDARGLYCTLASEGFSGAPEKQSQEAREIAEKRLGRSLTPSEASSYWFGRGLEFILRNPGKFTQLLCMKFLYFTGSYEYSTEYILTVERESVPVLWLTFVPFGLLAAFSLPFLLRACAIALKRRPALPSMPAGALLNRTGWLLCAAFCGNLLAILCFYVSSRYRLPAAPALIVFSGATLDLLFTDFLGGRRMAAATLFIFCLTAYGLFSLHQDESAVLQEANAHYNAGNILADRQEHERAVAEYSRAIQMNGSSYNFYYNKGNSLRRLNRFGEAAAAYAQAASLRPQFVKAHLRQGQMLEKLRDWAGAETAYRRAEKIHADDFELQFALGRVFANFGDKDQAIRHLDFALRMRPESEAARALRDGL